MGDCCPAEETTKKNEKEKAAGKTAYCPKKSRKRGQWIHETPSTSLSYNTYNPTI